MFRSIRLCCLFAVLALPLPSAEAAASGVVVLELFTSEGCSSCPMAEKLLNQVAEKAKQESLPIYAIAYHVTIWDALKTEHGSWKDPFGDQQWTQRQKEYLTVKPYPGVPAGTSITPHIYLNGDTFKGGNLGDHLKNLLSTPVPAVITLAWKDTGELTYAVAAAPAGHTLTLVLVESGLASDITAGENKGLSMVHDQVARWVTEVDLTKTVTGSLTIPMSDTLIRSRAQVIALVRGKDLSISGATSLPVPVDARQSSATVDSQEPPLILDPAVCRMGPDGQAICPPSPATGSVTH